MWSVGELISKGKNNAAIDGLDAKVTESVFNYFQVLPILGLGTVGDLIVSRTGHIGSDQPSDCTFGRTRRPITPPFVDVGVQRFSFDNRL